MALDKIDGEDENNEQAQSATQLDLITTCICM